MRTRRAGWSILEMLVYLGALSVVIGCAYPALHQALAHSRALERHADQITSALHAGERWRADVRAATGPIIAGDGKLVIPQAAGAVEYRLASNAVWRTVAGRDRWLVRGVQASAMQSDRRQRVAAWRWELELMPATKSARSPALFTFVAVGGEGAR